MLNNCIKISPNSIIYIVIPNIVTGGPEALHQLGLELKKNLMLESIIGHFSIIILYTKNIKLNL